jgi:hypothetical protein
MSSIIGWLHQGAALMSIDLSASFLPRGAIIDAVGPDRWGEHPIALDSPRM